MLRSPRIALLCALGLVTAPGSLLAETPPAAAVKQIRAVGEDAGTVVEIWADGRIGALRHFSLPDPPRLVVDFPGLRSELSSHEIPVGNGQVERVRVGRHGDKVRVVIEVSHEVLAGARLARSDQGVAFVFGEAEIPRLAERSAAEATASAPTPSLQQGDSAEQLSRAAQDLAAAARELSAVVRELKGARLAAAPESPGTPAPVASPIAASKRSAALRSAASSTRSSSPALATAPDAVEDAARELQAATREVQQAAPPPSVAASPPAIALAPPSVTAPAVQIPSARLGPGGGYAPTYAGVMQWLEEHRDTVPRFAAGDILGQGDLAKLRPFLPPGYYEEFDFPETRLAIQPTVSHAAHDSYRQATLQYQKQTAIGADGSLENHIAGLPFDDARIAGASPRDAGLMVGWNNIFRWQHFGYRASPIPMAYIAPGNEVPSGRAAALSGGGRVERVLVIEYQRVYLSHQAALADQNFELKVSDADSQHFKDWMHFTEPFDMRGMAFVIERFRDPHEPDQVNSYLPTERKIRRISSKERSDSFLGSEMTMDDFEGFSGRVLDYEWQYRGMKDVMHVSDSRGPHSVFFGPMSHVPNDHWQLRRCHVVETRPILPGHPHARKLVFYDAETYNIPMTLVFDANDQLLKVIYTIYKWPGGTPSGDPAETVSHYRSSVVINKQTRRSMVNWSEHTEIPEMKASTVRRLFNVSSLTGGR